MKDMTNVLLPHSDGADNKNLNDLDNMASFGELGIDEYMKRSQGMTFFAYEDAFKKTKRFRRFCSYSEECVKDFLNNTLENWDTIHTLEDEAGLHPFWIILRYLNSSFDAEAQALKIKMHSTPLFSFDVRKNQILKNFLLDKTRILAFHEKYWSDYIIPDACARWVIVMDQISGGKLTESSWVSYCKNSLADKEEDYIIFFMDILVLIISDYLQQVLQINNPQVYVEIEKKFEELQDVVETEMQKIDDERTSLKEEKNDFLIAKARQEKENASIRQESKAKDQQILTLERRIQALEKQLAQSLEKQKRKEVQTVAEEPKPVEKPEPLPEIIKERYLFYCDPSNSKGVDSTYASIGKAFPNSQLVHTTDAFSKDCKAVVLLCKYIGHHGAYYNAKNICANNQIPVIHSNAQNIEMIKQDVLLRKRYRNKTAKQGE